MKDLKYKNSKLNDLLCAGKYSCISETLVYFIEMMLKLILNQ